jgi:hypothetical protein
MTGVPKPKRFESQENLDRVRNAGCSVCGSRHADVHHIKTRGAGGTDSLDNIIGLCRLDHARCHQLGSYRFVSLHLDKINEHRAANGLPLISRKSL